VPVLGDVTDAHVDHLARRLVRRVAAADADPPRAHGAQPGDRVDQLALTVGVDAGEPDDLAPTHGEADAAQRLEPAVVDHVHVLDLEQRLARLRGRLVDAE
jgi:hypothetical protein